MTAACLVPMGPEYILLLRSAILLGFASLAVWLMVEIIRLRRVEEIVVRYDRPCPLPRKRR